MIADKLGEIERFLSRRGITLQVTRQPPLGVAEIATAEERLGRPLPEALKTIYTQFADGFEVFWEEIRSPTDFDFARFGLPALGRLVDDSVSFQGQTREQLDDPEGYFERADEARPVLRRMLDWGVLWDTGGDGNLVCIDLPSGAVVFHEREWSFSKPYMNGALIATSVNRLIADWGSVCFVNFPGCPGDCPAAGASAIPGYEQQRRYMIRGDGQTCVRESGGIPDELPFSSLRNPAHFPATMNRPSDRDPPADVEPR